jgi:hypothetical protein
VLYEHGIESVDIVLIKKYPCNDKAELHARERYFIESNNCANIDLIGQKLDMKIFPNSGGKM